MSYRDNARSVLAEIFTRNQGLPKNVSSPDQLTRINELISAFLRTEEVGSLLIFLSEYAPKMTTQFGFLFNPLPSQIDLSPLLQASPNPQSQYYCAKIELSGFGHIFIIPLSGKQASFCIVLKPSRSLRHDVRVMHTLIKGVPVIYLLPPYTDLHGSLSDWALAIEASEYSHQ